MANMGNENRTSWWMKKSMHSTSTGGYITKSIKISEEKPISEKEQKIKEDGKARLELQRYIAQKQMEGKSKEEILKRLIFVYRDAKYQKYRKYYEIWIDHVFKDNTLEER